MGMNSEDYKNVFASKTIWGVVVMLIGTVTGQALPVEFAGQIADTISAVFTTVGAGLAIYGRAKAEKKITVLPTE